MQTEAGMLKQGHLMEFKGTVVYETHPEISLEAEVITLTRIVNEDVVSECATAKHSRDWILPLHRMMKVG